MQASHSSHNIVNDQLVAAARHLSSSALNGSEEPRDVAHLLLVAAANTLEIEHAAPIVERALSMFAQRAKTDRSRGGLAGWQRRRVTQFVDQNLDATLRTDQLATVACLSLSYFSRAFRQSFGESPYAFVVRRRLGRAKRMMVETDESLCQIALECGLADQSHLSRLFRQHFGMSPKEWRRSQKLDSYDVQRLREPAAIGSL